jgi:hypothetical protein
MEGSRAVGIKSLNAAVVTPGNGSDMIRNY